MVSSERDEEGRVRGKRLEKLKNGPSIVGWLMPLFDARYLWGSWGRPMMIWVVLAYLL